MQKVRFGVDLAKSVFQVHGVDEDGVIGSGYRARS